jgi:hypothetical protein
VPELLERERQLQRSTRRQLAFGGSGPTVTGTPSTEAAAMAVTPTVPRSASSTRTTVASAASPSATVTSVRPGRLAALSAITA